MIELILTKGELMALDDIIETIDSNAPLYCDWDENEYLWEIYAKELRAMLKRNGISTFKKCVISMNEDEIDTFLTILDDIEATGFSGIEGNQGEIWQKQVKQMERMLKKNGYKRPK
jgi:predicted sugar kinase